MFQNNEDARLAALYNLDLLDTAPSESFDRITRMAGQIFGLPIAAVSLTDHDRQWFKSRIGVDHCSIPRHKAPCAQVAESAETVLIPDLQADSCYSSSLLAQQGVRFYAGASLTTREGHSLGALCVLGTEPRETTEEELSALNDLAKMVMAQIELQHAFGRLDPISGLPNRNQFLEDLADLGRDRPGERRLVVLVDLARSEQLSNGLRVMGSAYLDQIVQDAASTISAIIGRARPAYHVATTQFAFLAEAGIEEHACVAELIGVLSQIQTRSKSRFVMATSIGVNPFIAGETPSATVLRMAHSAAQDARSCAPMVSVYSTTKDDAHQRRFQLLNDFEQAMKAEDQLTLVFQPRIELVDETCIGAEALLRWHHPELGQISPSEFIPIIEQTALARPMTKWVLNKALRQLAHWREAGLEHRMSVNVSVANLEDPYFAEQVQLQMLQHRVRPDWVELEVTESAIMSDVVNATSQLTALVAAGIHIAIDDFGTGYSSLAYLQKLPGKILKIDQSFIRELDMGERERTLVRSMVSLAHELGYHVVAEGVETASVRDWTIEMGCDEAQGYFYGRPMTSDDFLNWFSNFASRDDARVA